MYIAIEYFNTGIIIVFRIKASDVNGTRVRY